jgi:hypothetical protein
MTARSSRAAILLLFAVIGSTQPAEADPVVITLGKFQLNAHDTPVFDFRGAGFVLSGHSFDYPMPEGIFPFEDCFVCGAGTAIRLGSDIQERALAETASTSSATFGGVHYGPVFYSGNLGFESETVSAPAAPGELGFVSFARPFTMRGTLMAFGSSDRTGAPFFTADLTGAGTVRFLAHEGEPGQYNFSDLTYTFDADGVVPEPATLVLLGSGLLGVLVRARRRRNEP